MTGGHWALPDPLASPKGSINNSAVLKPLSHQEAVEAEENTEGSSCAYITTAQTRLFFSLINDAVISHKQNNTFS